MMDICLKDNDLVLVNGDISLCSTDQKALAQMISIRLKTLVGEWFMDSSLGIPYLSEIFGQKRSQMYLRQTILPHIEAIPGVKEITDFKVEENDEDKADRKIWISFTVVLNDESSLKFNEPIGV